MTKLDLDYASYRKHRQRLTALVIAVMPLYWLAMEIADYRELSRRLASMEAKTLDRGLGQVQSRKPISEEERRDGRYAAEALRSLNTSWDSLFDALEKVQQQNPQIRLIDLHPNPERGMLTLSGEAPDFASLMDYLAAMRSMEKSFHDVRLLNQRTKEAEQGGGRLAFTLSAGWRR